MKRFLYQVFFRLSASGRIFRDEKKQTLREPCRVTHQTGCPLRFVPHILFFPPVPFSPCYHHPQYVQFAMFIISNVRLDKSALPLLCFLELTNTVCTHWHTAINRVSTNDNNYSLRIDKCRLRWWSSTSDTCSKHHPRSAHFEILFTEWMLPRSSPSKFVS